MKTKKAAKKPSPAVLHARENKLLDELCQKHGYMFQDAPKGQRIVMTFVKTPKPRVEASYKILLIVPATSALGEQFAERYKQLDKTKAKK